MILVVWREAKVDPGHAQICRRPPVVEVHGTSNQKDQGWGKVPSLKDFQVVDCYRGLFFWLEVEPEVAHVSSLRCFQ